MTDDRMETITDPEQIRAVWEAGDMGEESLGGDSESGTYNRSNRPPAGPRPDADNPWALLPDDHPERPKQCGGCGTKWVDAETAGACERRHGDDLATTPAPVGAAVALDLDAVEAEFLRQCGGCDAGLMVGCTCSQRDFRPTMLALVAEVRRLTRLGQCDLDLLMRAEAAEAEVVTLRARLAAVEALHWKVGGACSHCSQRSDYAVAWPCETAVALAVTTGEGQ